MSRLFLLLPITLLLAVDFLTGAQAAPTTHSIMSTPSEKLGFLVVVTAKQGKAAAVKSFLESALPLAEAETGTQRWYAFQIDERQFGIFDTFADEADRTAHANGPIAAALLANADELLEGFDASTDLNTIQILANK